MPPPPLSARRFLASGSWRVRAPRRARWDGRVCASSHQYRIQREPGRARAGERGGGGRPSLSPLCSSPAVLALALSLSHLMTIVRRWGRTAAAGAQAPVVGLASGGIGIGSEVSGGRRRERGTEGHQHHHHHHSRRRDPKRHAARAAIAGCGARERETSCQDTVLTCAERKRRHRRAAFCGCARAREKRGRLSV